MEEYMIKTADRFFAALHHAGKELQDFSQELNQRDHAVKTALEEFSSQLATQTVVSKDDGSPITMALFDVLQDINHSVVNWKNKVLDYQKSQQFMHDHEKFLVVMVFGAVKSGKSTLGNFIAGREWLKTNFDNVYKHQPPTEFATQEKGRDTGDIEHSEDGRTWFSEGVTDTTGDIQYFTLSGLRWFDSPGTGALAKKGDRRNMEEMVNEYLKYVDLCVFLINSSEPGLMEDMKYMEKLSREEQEAMVVITKSDKIEEDIDDEGNLIQKVIAKSEENRNLQEQDMCKRLQEAYPQLDSEKFHALSLSTWLAKDALQTGDDKEFQASHLDVFMNKLAEKAQSNVLELKTARPKKAMNHFLQELIDGDDNLVGTKGLLDKLQLILDSVNEYKQSVEQRTNKMAENITRHTWSAVERAVSQMAQQTEESGKSIEAGTIEKVVLETAQPIIADTINQEISQIIGLHHAVTRQLAMDIAAPSLGKTEIRQKTEQMAHSETKYYKEPRDPEGIIENIRHYCFGKKYYRIGSYKRTWYSTVAVGSNIEEVLNELMPKVNEYVIHTVRKNLNRIGNEYFAKQESAVLMIDGEIHQLEKRLRELQYK